MDPRSALIVTDIDLSGWALRQALTCAGFVVLTASDAEAARAVVAASDPFDVLVVSQSLGPERVTRLLGETARLWPGVPAIVLAVDPDPHPIEARAGHVVLEKPYSVDNVVTLARRLCGVPDAGWPDASAGARGSPRPWFGETG